MNAKDLIDLARPGDIFAAQGSGMLSRIIQFGQWLEDCEESPFNHIGGFVAENFPHSIFETRGSTIESRARIGWYRFSDQIGRRVMIARHRMMDQDRYKAGIHEVLDNCGQIYPAGRLLLHAADMIRVHAWKKLTGLGIKRRVCSFSLHEDWPVCSELWAQFLLAAGLPTGFPDGKDQRWRGVSPDDFYDAWNRAPHLWEVIFHGRVD